ncbi:hypothetical protein CLLI_04920 [Clostridium liquoris]|jgi:hypothetical protein|uniref:ABC-2 family transporter protein n=1 Tax=Clostridium liquoris TaxID=1289519 RepID=A0A2T0B889_9CLOT|nr:hypothetical protein [Clostridium liquoris]PRR80108.1 hypothetical protein CLLI_04920 [Clostridium liquoris]
MGNLIKYEIKGYLKETLGLIAVIIISNILLLAKVDAWTRQTILALSTFITIATIVVVFVWNIKNFSRDLKENTAYLLFSLPISSNSLLASKLITSFIQYIAVLFTNFIFLYYNSIKIKLNINEAISKLNIGFILLGIFYCIITYVGLLCVIYFSIALSKAAVKKKRKIAKLGSWVIFIITCIGITKISDLLYRFFPQTFSVNAMNLNTLSGDMTIMVSDQLVNINIAQSIFDICIAVVFFIATSYLLRKKLDI